MQKKGHKEIVLMLLDAGANVDQLNTKAKNEETVLALLIFNTILLCALAYKIWSRRKAK